MAHSARLILGLVVVVTTMLALFTAPSNYFVLLTFVSTGCMIGAAYLGGLRLTERIRWRPVLFGVATAAVLYGVFYLGGAAIDLFHPFGITSATESSIYSLVASPSNPPYVQVLLLVFDSAGYESFFRGVLQNRLQSRLGPGSAAAVALFDAALHLASLNPVWIGGTFVTDFVWGLTYYYGKGVQGSFVSHVVWDIAIFIVRPVR